MITFVKNQFNQCYQYVVYIVIYMLYMLYTSQQLYIEKKSQNRKIKKIGPNK